MQGAVEPHLQLPAVQRSACDWLQAVQVPLPADPHARVVFPTAQVFPLQQPVVQLLASHTQVLVPEQRWPAAHAGLLPQRHPDVEQLSAVIPHAAQLIGFVPHSASVGGLTQVVPLQHPFAQLVASQMQAPPEQRCPTAQIAPPPH